MDFIYHAFILQESYEKRLSALVVRVIEYAIKHRENPTEQLTYRAYY